MRIPRFQRFQRFHGFVGFVGFQVPLLLAAAGAVCLAVAIAACSQESPVAPAVTQCNVTQTLNVPAEGQQFSVSAPACGLIFSSVSVDVPWISVGAPQASPRNPIFDTVVGVVGVNSGPERIGHLTTPLGLVTIIQSAGNCVTAIAPTSQAFDENGGAGSFSVTAVPGCAWDATSHTPTGLPYDITPLTAHGIGSGVVPFTIAANSNTFARAWSYLVGGSLTFQITQSRCPVTVSPLNFHVGAADGSFSIAVTSRDFCYWGAAYVLPIAKFITLAASGETVRGSGTVQFSVAQNQTGQARSGSLSVAEQIVTVTQDP